MSRAAVALGSNLGDRAAHLRTAVAALRALGDVKAVSSLYETAPVGGPVQGPYLNAVVVIDTELSAATLLAELHRIEAAAGRTRETRWGPRVLDLDLVVFDEKQIDKPDLVVPHPRAAERRFVLEPLAEVWPQAQVAPGLAAAEALARVQDQRVERSSLQWLDSEPTVYPPPNNGGGWVAAQLALLASYGVALALGADLLEGPLGVVTGVLLTAGGAVLALGAVSALGPSLTPFPQPRRFGSVVESGPYRLVRHPIYGGLLLGLTGVALFTGKVAALVVVGGLAVLFWLKANEEERRLSLTFPGYEDYRRRVRRRFVPWVL